MFKKYMLKFKKVKFKNTYLNLKDTYAVHKKLPWCALPAFVRLQIREGFCAFQCRGKGCVKEEGIAVHMLAYYIRTY